MTLFVLDRTGATARLGQAHCWLHRPLAAGGLHLIADAARAPAGAARSLRATLLRERHREWDLVLLLPLGAKGLVEQVDHVQRVVLGPLSNLGYRPRTRWVLAVDRVPRDADGVPRDADARRSWYLDTRGRLPDSDAAGPCFSELDVKRLSHTLASLKANKPQGRHAQYRDAVREALDELFDRKAHALSPNPATSRYDDSDFLQTTRRLMEERGVVRQTGDHDPAQAFRNLLHERYSLQALLEDGWHLARLQQTTGPDAVLKDAVRLAHLLLVLREDQHLARTQRAADPRRTSPPLCLEAIDWNPRAGPILHAYERRLAYHELRLERDALERPEPVDLPTYDDHHCACPNAVQPLPLRAAHFGAFARQADDRRTWRSWLEATDRALRTLRSKQDETVRACFVRTHPLPDPNTHRVDDLPLEGERREQAWQEQRQHLLELPFPQTLAFDFEQACHTTTHRLRDLLAVRPTRTHFGLLVGVALALMLAPFLLLLALGPAPTLHDWLVLTAAVTAATLAVTAATLRHLNRRLRRLTRTALTLAEGIRRRLNQRYEDKRRHVEAHCRVRVARRNHETAQTALADRARHRMLARYHHAHLRQHRANAALMRERLFPPAPAPSDDTVAPPLDLHRPVQENHVYHPQPGTPNAYAVEWAGTDRTVESADAVALRRVVFRNDAVLRPTPDA